MFFENQANDQQHSYNQLTPNIRFSTRSLNTQQNQITDSKILNCNQPPPPSHPEETSLQQTLNSLELYTVFGQSEQPLSLFHQEFVAII